jgi:glyoxylase-like metal-dependent hydrolase (beta-lactamase superfamily II)
LILKKLIVGMLGTNCYIFGSNNKIVIIDPGAEPKVVIENVENLNNDIVVISVILTHGHFDHSMKAQRIVRHFKVPLMYSDKKTEIMPFKKDADQWLKEGDMIELDSIKLNVLETPGHSPGSICLYSKDVKEINGKRCDGIIFTGDLLFRRSVGRTDIMGGNQKLLFENIKKKIMQNPAITDNFIIFPGHMGNSTVGEERIYNMFKNYFL